MATQIAPNAAAHVRIDSAKRIVLASLIVMSKMFSAFANAATTPMAVVSRLLQIPFTCIGMICINIGCFHIVHDWGWITTGFTLVILEAMIADKDDA